MRAVSITAVTADQLVDFGGMPLTPAMPVKPPKAKVARRRRHFRFVPILLQKSDTRQLIAIS